eukprot:scaffold152_cov163-Amphora_coffeaeformis.AAC.12
MYVVSVPFAVVCAAGAVAANKKIRKSTRFVRFKRFIARVGFIVGANSSRERAVFGKKTEAIS